MSNIEIYKKPLDMLPEAYFTGKMTKEKFINIALSMIEGNQNLAKCSPESVFKVMSEIAQVGLSPLPSAHEVYIIPYGNTAQLSVGYKGLLRIIYRSNLVDVVRAGVIRENDKVEYEDGLEVKFKITKSLTGGKIIGAWALAILKSGETVIRVLDSDAISKRKNAAKTKNTWNQWEEEMAMKSAIRALANFLPKDFEMEEVEMLNSRQDMYDFATEGDFELKELEKEFETITAENAGDLCNEELQELCKTTGTGMKKLKPLWDAAIKEAEGDVEEANKLIIKKLKGE